MERRYINLTSGLEFYQEGDRVVRLESSLLEAKAYWRFVRECDIAFLIDAALGGVVLVDAGSRRGPTSRAQWLGVPWLRYCYAKVNGLDVPKQGIEPQYLPNFDAIYDRDAKDMDRAKNKFRYVYKMTGSESLCIQTASHRSSLDGDYDALRRILREKVQ